MAEPTAEPRTTATGSAIVLKKYGNRRLYDTSASRYVTLAEVEAMVQKGTDIVVVDAKTGEDLTKEVLVQMILEREGARDAIPTGFLKTVVRLANSPMKEGLSRVVQDGLDGFLHGQRALVDTQRAVAQQVMQQMNAMAQMPWNAGGMPQMPQAGPMPSLSTMWNPFAAVAPPPGPVGTGASAAPAAPAQSPQPSAAPPSVSAVQMQQSGDIDALKADLAQTQAMLKALLQRETAGEAPRGKGRASSKTPAKSSGKTTPRARKKG